ncbi:MAG: hypothetical protein U9N44_02190 [Chloroflexota bacterium]|nr:hypothetical protein [Chloroflexota bacterium]
MIKVTTQGLEELKNVLEQIKCQGCGHEHGEEAAAAECSVEDMILRLIATEDGGLGLILDVPRDGDKIVAHENADLLLVGPELVEAVEGLVMDCAETPDGRSLTINPA